MNTIGTVAFDFKMKNEEFARSLYVRWDNFFTVNFEKIADRLLMKYDENAVVVLINKLDIDLGVITEDRFDEHFPRLVEEKLEEALVQMLHDRQSTEKTSLSEKDYLFGILCKFLLHGSLPWNIENEYRNINCLFLTVLQNESEQLKSFLQTYGHYTSLQQRLVYQLSDPELEQGVRLLAPGESVFICSYLNLLRVKYHSLESAVLHESDHRNTIWLIVYAYLLTNRSSYFNKKSFMIATIERLALSLTLSYDNLLTIIVSDLGTWQTKQIMPSGLYLILNQLRKDLTEKNLKKSLIDAKRLYISVLAELNNNQGRILNEDTLNLLLTTLANSESCRRFLKQMKEDQIFELVSVVVPDNREFVIEYAQSLDKQHEHGVLQGKSGSEFRLLKWQIIFPVLLDNRGAAFNQKYFVRGVISQVAAHYNLEISDILKYICLYIDEFVFSKTLNLIFQDLLDEYQTRENHKEVHSSTELFVQSLRNIIKKGKSINIEDMEDVVSRLSDSNKRRKIIEILSEEEHYYLISLIIPTESHFVIPYTIILGDQRNNNILGSKACSEFSQIKWRFIYEVLLAFRNQVFNKKYFVSKTLNKIAAHYNVMAEELLDYFYQEKMMKNISLPFDLALIFKELSVDYKLDRSSKTTKMVGENINDEFSENKKLLELCFGNSISHKILLEKLSKQYDFVLFIREALRTIQTLIHYLESELNIPVNRGNIIRCLLDMSKRKVSLNIDSIVAHIINLMISEIPKTKQILFIRKMESQTGVDDLLAKQFRLINNKKDMMENNDLIDVDNAGLVILAPYLFRLFSMLSLIENGDFKDEKARTKAIFLLHYAVWEKEEACELELSMNKIFVGMEMKNSIPQKVELSISEKETVTSMLNGVLHNWEKLRNTSVVALREAFLRRNGRLEERDDALYLTVEEKAYDMLIDSIPWNFRMVRMPWMKKPAVVKWR